MTKHVLLIKLTSMGDLLHALPALSDAAQAIAGIQFDWVVDEAFAEIPCWHPVVNQVIVSAHRRWKKNLTQTIFSGELSRFYHQLNASDYDVIVDAQNNIKSAVIASLRRGKSHGLDKHSVGEKPAHWAYSHHYTIDKSQHAITRQRQLMAASLGYTFPDTEPDFNIDYSQLCLPSLDLPQHYLFFIHNASWTTKLWPEPHWQQLIKKAAKAGYQVLLPCGNQQELQRSQRLAANHDNAIVLPELSLSEIAGIVKNAAGTVGCDTGLGHLSGLLKIPSVSFYGPTNHQLVGAIAKNQQDLIANSSNYPCSPCYQRHCTLKGGSRSMSYCMESFSAEEVWNTLTNLMAIN